MNFFRSFFYGNVNLSSESCSPERAHQFALLFGPNGQKKQRQRKFLWISNFWQDIFWLRYLVDLQTDGAIYRITDFLSLVVVDCKKYDDKGSNLVEMFLRCRRAFPQSLAFIRQIFLGQRPPNLKKPWCGLSRRPPVNPQKI